MGYGKRNLNTLKFQMTMDTIQSILTMVNYQTYLIYLRNQEFVLE